MKNQTLVAFTQEQLDRLELIASETPAERRRRLAEEFKSEYPGKDPIERAHAEWKDPVARAKTYLGTPEKEAAFKEKWLDDYYGEV